MPNWHNATVKQQPVAIFLSKKNIIHLFTFENSNTRLLPFLNDFFGTLENVYLLEKLSIHFQKMPN